MKKLIATFLMALVLLTPVARANRYPFGITGDESIDKMACLVAASYDRISFSITDEGYSIVPENGTIYGGDVVKIVLDTFFDDGIILTIGFVHDYDDDVLNVLYQIIADVSYYYGEYDSAEKEGMFDYDIEWDDFELSTSYHQNFNDVLFALMWFIPKG